MTTPDAIGETAKLLSWSKIVKGTATKKYVDQCCTSEHATVFNRELVAAPEAGCFMSILLFVCLFSVKLFLLPKLLHLPRKAIFVFF